VRREPAILVSDALTGKPAVWRESMKKGFSTPIVLVKELPSGHVVVAETGALTAPSCAEKLALGRLDASIWRVSRYFEAGYEPDERAVVGVGDLDRLGRGAPLAGDRHWMLVCHGADPSP